MAPNSAQNAFKERSPIEKAEKCGPQSSNPDLTDVTLVSEDTLEIDDTQKDDDVRGGEWGAGHGG